MKNILLRIALLGTLAACGETELIEPDHPYWIAFGFDPYRVEVGDSVQVSVSAAPFRGGRDTVLFASLDTSVATIGARGWIRGVRPGTARVAATVPRFHHFRRPVADTAIVVVSAGSGQ